MATDSATDSATDAAGGAGRPPGDPGWIVTSVGAAGLRAVTRARTHELVADEPRALGGTDEGPTPYEQLLAAIGGCMAITLRLYADRKGWPLAGVRVALRTARVHAADCASCETAPLTEHRIEQRVELDGPLDDAQRRRLLLIADRCPLKRTIEGGVRVVRAAPAPG